MTSHPESTLASMFASDASLSLACDSTGAFLLDRSPEYYSAILTYLRTGKVIVDNNVSIHGVLEEARYLQLDALATSLEEQIAVRTLQFASFYH